MKSAESCLVSTSPAKVVDITSARVNVMYVVHGFDIGGLEKCVVDLVNGIDRRYFNPSICCLTHTGASQDKLVRDDVRIFEMHKRTGNDFSLFFKLARLFHRERIQVVHSGNWGTYLESVIAARLARVPVVIHVKHGMETDQFVHKNGRKERVRNLVQYVFSNFHDTIITVSNQIKMHYVDSVRIPEEKIDVICNGVDIDLFRSCEQTRIAKRRELNVAEDEILLGSIGRLAPVKNYSSLLQAMQLVVSTQKNVKLILVGDGPEKERLSHQIAELHLTANVSLLGERSDIAGLLNAMDLFVLPSYTEGISIAMLEAMATGLPLVATDVGGNAELVENGVNGLLFPSDHHGQLAQAILKCVETNSLRMQMGERSREKAVKHLCLAAMVEAYCELYHRCLSRRA